MEEPTDDQSPDIALTPDPTVTDPTPTEIPSKLTLNKNGKPRKQLGPEALEKLAKARAKANALTKQNTLKKLEEKVEKMKVDEIEEPEAQQVVKKKVVKKKPQIIIEQSSDDEDEFQENDRVIFVKRVSRKKKEKEPEPEPIPPPVMRQEADVPKPKPVNPLQRQYDSMFSGQFLNQQRMSRR
jgi:hypothetical protein